MRQLATHASGLVYEFWNTDIPRWMAVTSHLGILSGLKASRFYAMAHEPGSQWDYGIGIDWLGQVVEAVDGRRIDKFCQEEIFSPLGMTSTACEAEGALATRLGSVSARGEKGQFGPFEIAPPAHPEFYGMGHTLYSTAGDHMRFLRMFLNKDVLDGNRVLSEKGVQTMQANHIGDLRVGKLTTAVPPPSVLTLRHFRVRPKHIALVSCVRNKMCPACALRARKPGRACSTRTTGLTPPKMLRASS